MVPKKKQRQQQQAVAPPPPPPGEARGGRGEGRGGAPRRDRNGRTLPLSSLSDSLSAAAKKGGRGARREGGGVEGGKDKERSPGLEFEGEASEEGQASPGGEEAAGEASEGEGAPKATSEKGTAGTGRGGLSSRGGRGAAGRGNGSGASGAQRGLGAPAAAAAARAWSAPGWQERVPAKCFWPRPTCHLHEAHAARRQLTFLRAALLPLCAAHFGGGSRGEGRTRGGGRAGRGERERASYSRASSVASTGSRSESGYSSYLQQYAMPPIFYPPAAYGVSPSMVGMPGSTPVVKLQVGGGGGRLCVCIQAAGPA